MRDDYDEQQPWELQVANMKLIRKLQEELCHKENDIKEANFKIVSYKKTNSDLGAKVKSLVAEKNAGIDANLERAATVTPTRTVLETPGNNAFDTAGIDANLESAATVTDWDPCK